MYGLGNGMGGGFNVWTWIILILIVLQWFRVGGGFGGPGGPGGGESNLLCNGGLFIIALFLLVACSCFKNPVGIYPQAISPMRYC
jgi:hypothetical protein